MPSPPPLAYRFEGEPLDETALRAELGVPPGWARGLPATLFAPGYRRALRFVGLLGAGRGLLVVLPKYLRGRTAADWLAPATSHAAETRLLLHVLQRYRRQAIGQLPAPADHDADDPNDDDDPAAHAAGEPAVALALVADYQAHGYWHQPQTELGTWPGARPDWPRTVARAQPLLAESGPLYPVPYGYRQPPGAAASVLERLHRWAVRHCLETYRDVLPGFGQTGYDPDAADDPAEIADPDYLRQVLAHARQTTFHDGHLRTLRLLQQLLDTTAPTNPDQAPTSLLGTTAFHRVWELACQAAFANRSAELQARLPVPTWHPAHGPAYQNARNRLIPDVVWYDERTLLVADAKYYVVAFGPGPQVQGGPGMPDLTKQVLYEQALGPLLPATARPRRVLNVLLLPATRPPQPPDETPAAWHWGHVQTNIPGWDDRRLAAWFIPPAHLFQAWLEARPLAWQPTDVADTAAAAAPVV